jgi:hypothetical protein
MNGNASKLREILRRFRFEEPVPAGTQAAMLGAKRRNLVMVLRAAGAYGAFDGLVLSLYFAFERAGYRISYRSGRMMLAAAAVLAAALAGIAIYMFTIRVLPGPVPGPPHDRVIEEKKGRTDDGVVPDRKRVPGVVPPAVVNVRLGIRTFTADGLDGAVASGTAKAVYDEIAALCGRGCVAWYDDPGRRVNVNFVLTGSVRKVDDEYWVNLKVLSVETGAVTFSEGRKAPDAGGLVGAARGAAHKIADKIR